VYTFRPNAGFSVQLDLFDQMGGTIDKQHPVYRKYRLSILSERAQLGMGGQFFFSTAVLKRQSV